MAEERKTVLALNCGSSSLKFGVYQATPDEAEAVCEGEAEEVGGRGGSFWFRRGDGDRVTDERGLPDHQAALELALGLIAKAGEPRIEAVGHRIVHGGPKIRSHTLLNQENRKELEAACEYAPLHMPASLAVLDAAERKLPGVPQAICLDTAFHRTMPDVARTYALPGAVREMGVERYGFHGLSLESIVSQLRRVPERLVVAHLGSGASVTAIRGGKSVDTTMGLTPTGGVIMGTRPGDLDPGALVFLMRHGYGDADRLEDLLDHRSGLLGASGLTNDVRELERQRQANQDADLALRMFAYSVRKAIAGMAAALGGVELVVFTGGIGEHSEQVREEIMEGLKFLNGGGLEVSVLPSQEDGQIAKNTARLLARES